MKKLILIIFSALTITSNAAFLQGSVSVDLTATGPYLVFSVRAYPGAGNVVDGWTTIDWFVTYNSTYNLTFGTPVVNTTDFTGVSMTYYGQNIMGSPGGGLVSEYWGFTGAATTTETYVAGTTYEMFRVPINTAAVDFGDINIAWDNITYVTYFSLTGSTATDWTAAGQGASQPVFFGPGTYTGDNGNNFVPGVSGTANYLITDKPVVPMVLWDNAVWAGGTGTGNQPGSGDGSKKLYVKDPSGQLTQNGGAVSSFTVTSGSDLSIQPGGTLSASGATAVTGANALKVIATTAGVGSFIDNGTITYPSSGSASVQTYIKNSASPGNFWAHLVGPTINDPAFQTTMGYPGVYLQAFNVLNSNTYAYRYQEAGNSWLNIFANTTPVRTAHGILLSTVNTGDQTMTMTGNLVTGAVTTAALQHTSNYLDLLSNPYPSAIDFNLFYAANNTAITNKYYLYDPGAGNYVFYIVSGGGTLTKDIQVGQGFFVETLNSVPVTFNNTMRLHSSVPFLKDGFAYQLRLNLEGNGYKDASFIHFKEAGTGSYDEMHDVYKWWSMLSEASEIWTIGPDDQAALGMNALPTLGASMVSVPMNFKCGANDVYTITAENIGSFDPGTEIYLEDLSTGEPWHSFIDNPIYSFNGNPLGIQGRFIVHFFGPTGIDDPKGHSAVQIYGYGQDAYIVNRSSQTIKEYRVYDMMGRELQSGSLPNSTVNKVTIGDVSAYYIVKVITREGGVYTDKVYITK